MRTARLRQLAFVFVAVLGVLTARLFQLQILQNDKWTETARISRTGKNTIPFRRGRILDRNNVVLATDRQAYDLYFRYRDFRRGFIAAQLYEALHLVGYAPEGLVDCLRRGEELGAFCLALKPQDLDHLAPGQRDDLLFYLTAMTGNRSYARRVAVQDWEAEGKHSFADTFPSALHDFQQRLVSARANLQFLESLLQSQSPVPLLQRLENRRRELDVLVARASLQQSAARALGQSSSSLRSSLAANSSERENLVRQLHERWQLDGSLAHFGVVLAPLPQRLLEQGSPDGIAHNDFQSLRLSQQAAVIYAVLQHLRVVAPKDTKGTLREQTARIHHLRVVPLERDLDFDVVDLLSQQASSFPGLYLQQVTQRLYPNETARMIVGSLRLPRPTDLEADLEQRERFVELRRQMHRTAAEEAEFRRLRDWWWSDSLGVNERKGQDGIEFVFESVLRGSRGYLQELEGGADGELPLELLFSPPQDGVDVKLSLDARFIAAAERVIPKVYGETIARLHELQPQNLTKALQQFDPTKQNVGFVILDLRTGEVPLLVSTPQVSRIELRKNFEVLKELHSSSPLRNRALGGGFYGEEQPYPGSTFKPLVAAAALAQNPDLWQLRYICEGVYTPPGRTRAIKCDSRYGHQEVDMREALKKSCNIYFYHLGNDIGAAAMYELATQLGFQDLSDGSQDTGTGNELSFNTRLERGANYFAPLRDLERDVLKRMRTAIGQVGVRSSPLQMARLFGWLATGQLVRPKLVLEGGGGSPASEELRQPPISRQTRERIADALAAVVYEEGGTAYRTEFPAAWQIVAKTGTAEVGTDRFGNQIPTHSWLTGYFPADNPHYAFAVLCENTGLHGGQISSYILKEFLSTPEGMEFLQ